MSMAANAMPLPSGPVRSSTERRGILFIISAPSGTGKTTLCKQLASNIPGLWHSISYTTRKPRPGEEHGREYFFADEATFQAMIDRHEFVEWARVYGHLYGTPRKTLTVASSSRICAPRRTRAWDRVSNASSLSRARGRLVGA